MQSQSMQSNAVQSFAGLTSCGQTHAVQSSHMHAGTPVHAKPCCAELTLRLYSLQNYTGFMAPDLEPPDTANEQMG